MRTVTLAVSSLVATAAAQTALYGVRGNGELLRIDPATGAAVLIGNTGVECKTAAVQRYFGWAPNGESILCAGSTLTPDRIDYVNRWNAAAWTSISPPGRPDGYAIRGIFAGHEEMYVILAASGTGGTDLYARIGPYSYPDAYTIIGPTGQSNLTALAWGLGTLCALGTDNGGSLYTLDHTTGATTLIGSGGFGGDDLALCSLPDGTLLSCGANLRSVNQATGATTIIGPTGFTDIRGLVAISRTGCYVNCNHDVSVIPCLNVQDFACFLNRFASGDPYANCDESTTPPVLNIQDLMCFLNRFNAACSAC